MKVDLTVAQTEQIIRDFLSNPPEDAEVAIRLSPATPLRVSTSRGGGLVVYTGADAAKKPQKRKATEEGGTKKGTKKGGATSEA